MLADSACVSLASKASHSDSSSVTFDTIRFCSDSGGTRRREAAEKTGLIRFNEDFRRRIR